MHSMHTMPTTLPRQPSLVKQRLACEGVCAAVLQVGHDGLPLIHLRPSQVSTAGCTSTQHSRSEQHSAAWHGTVHGTAEQSGCLADRVRGHTYACACTLAWPAVVSTGSMNGVSVSGQTCRQAEGWRALAPVSIYCFPE